MDIAIHGRRVQVTDALRATVEEKVGRLTRFLEGMDRAEVRFSEERNPRIPDKEVCEVTMFGHGHIVRAKASAADVVSAIDRATDKLEHRVTRLKGKLVDRSHPRRNGSLHFAAGINPTTSDDDLDDGDTEREEGQPRIVKTKQFAIKPMTPEEAALQMDLLGHDFFFFTNAETDSAAVVYRRNDGDVVLIDAS